MSYPPILFSRSAILIISILGGGIALAVIAYVGICYACGCPASCRSPAKQFLYCFFDPEAQQTRGNTDRSRPMLEETAKEDYALLGDGKWEAKTTDEQDMMVAKVKIKDQFEWTIYLMLVWCIIWALPLFFWVDAMNADGGLAYEA